MLHALQALGYLSAGLWPFLLQGLCLLLQHRQPHGNVKPIDQMLAKDRRERFGPNPHGSSSAVIGTEACNFLEPMGTPRIRCCLLTGLLVRYQNRCAKSERYCISHSKRKSNWT